MRHLRTEASTYEIGKVMGQGHSATVVRAVKKDSRGHSRLNVALKILKSRTAVSWLEREFEALASVNSPYCVRVLGWENLEGQETPALVLEWIDGVTLFELARRAVLSETVCTEIIAQIQLGLRALSEKNLYHGDLSPTNVLINREGRVKLVDFAVRDENEEEIVGTPSYMAPELWSKQPPSTSADLFALGLLRIDLADQFNSVPIDAASAEDRARKISNLEGCSLTKKNPAERDWLSVETNESSERLLAQSVCRFLEAQISCPQTAALSAPVLLAKPQIRARVNFFRFSSQMAVSLFLIFFISAVAVRAQAPLANKVEPPAHLNIRTHRWMELTLNGKVLGFTPIDRVSLLPGQHRLTWRTATKAGERILNVKSAERVWLTETELLGNH